MSNLVGGNKFKIHMGNATGASLGHICKKPNGRSIVCVCRPLPPERVGPKNKSTVHTCSCYKLL